MITVKLAPAGPEHRACLTALCELYVYDLSAPLGLEVGQDGRFPALPIAPWFTGDPLRQPFLFRAGGNWAGFALVQQGSRVSVDASVYDMAEFFVLQAYRRRGVGERAAGLLFDRFRGRWEVRQKAENHPATAFWRRAIGRYTGGRFEELALDDERWRGPVQRFESRAVGA